jgi:hypothetical protein
VTVKGKRRLSEADVKQLKRKLGLHPRQPLFKCYAKSKQTANALDKEKGERFHSLPGHHCPECQCKMIAGCQTAHYGYGLCHVHERKIPPEKRAMEAEKHLVAIQGRNPFLHRDAEAFEMQVKEKSDHARIQIDFTKEIDRARDLVQEFIKKMEARQIDKACEDILPVLLETKELVQAGGNNLDMQRGILDKLDEIQEMMETPLTELAGGRKVKMSDKSYYEVLSKLIYNVGRMGVDQWTVNKHEVATKEQLHVWYGQLVDVIRRYIQDPKEWADFVNDLRVIKDPKMKSV